MKNKNYTDACLDDDLIIEFRCEDGKLHDLVFEGPENVHESDLLKQYGWELWSEPKVVQNPRNHDTSFLTKYYY